MSCHNPQNVIVTLTKNRILSGYEVPLGLLKHVITIGYTSPSNKKVIRDFLVANYQILAAQKVNRREERALRFLLEFFYSSSVFTSTSLKVFLGELDSMRIPASLYINHLGKMEAIILQDCRAQSGDPYPYCSEVAYQNHLHMIIAVSQDSRVRMKHGQGRIKESWFKRNEVN